MSTSTNKPLDILEVIMPDHLGCWISERWVEWDSRRRVWMNQKEELQRYLFATDTRQTSNSKLPWSNSTVTPKLTQIRDNLYANYMATLFPKRKWLTWEGNAAVDEDIEKKRAIESYMSWVVDRNDFYEEAGKLILDYIDYGNCFATVEWSDATSLRDDKTQVGYAGPRLRRINPLDIQFDPSADSFEKTHKIIRSLVTIGQLKEIMESESTDEHDKEEAKKLFDYVREIRHRVGEFSGEWTVKDVIYNIAGFDSFTNYLGSGFVEVLTFYGDVYDDEKNELLKNQVIKVVDRHKIISQYTHPSFFSTAPVFHSGWRIRPDNLWAMGPLDNLVGMQYRIDHLENLKADVWDLTAYPMIKIKGYAEDFELGPLARIYVGDDGDVELMSPDVGALQANNEIALLEQKMEEMAGSPKEAMGFRTPGEKTMYEVQRMENAANRIFQSKTAQVERQAFEPAINAMLELGRRLMTDQTIRLFDTELKIAIFKELTPEDITGNGRLRPIAARNFADKATQLQNLNNFYQSNAGQDPAVNMHISGVKSAQMIEELLDLEEFKIFEPYVRIAEQADAQRLMQTSQEQVAMEGQTPGGLWPGDSDEDALTSMEDQPDGAPPIPEGV